MIYKYPQEVHDFVKANCGKLRDRDLAEECNKALGTSFTTNSMKAFRANHHYKNGKPKHWTTEEFWRWQKFYPQGMYEFVRDNSWGVSSAEMSRMIKEKFDFDYSPTAVKQFRQRWGIRSGVTGWYQKGHPPGTKGKTLEEICKGDPDKLARVKATQYKKGQKPQNELPLGTITKTTNGYVIRKKAMEGSFEDRWEYMHRVVWEEHHGPVPDGSMIIFKDGNKENYDISNLMLISRSITGAMAKAGYYAITDPELKEAAAKVAELKVKTNKIKRRGTKK